MIRWYGGLCASAICAVSVALAGCGGSDTQIGSLPANAKAAPTRVSPAYGVIYNFQGPPKDGEQPFSSLTYSKGTFYGTTAMGGKTDNGTIFAILPGSQNDTVYSFGGASGGADPKAGVSILDGVAYGTTTGSTSTHGTVYTLSSGGPSTIYEFKGGYDGAVPTAQLNYISSAGAFYSTTVSGGYYGQGTVFSITSSGYEQILYSFKGYSGGDGAKPVAGLLNTGRGTLYGTTEWGGQYNKGTLYSVSLSGQEKIVHSFGNSSEDGTFPESGLADGPSGTLYGTTDDGGAHGKGTVYKVSSHSGQLSIVYSFRGNPDGAYPLGGIYYLNGVLYGTTSGGGTHSQGTVFKIAAGKESVMHDFPAFSGDGKGPSRRLSYENGMLYGTTKTGGTGSCPGSGGCGTLFEIAP